MLSPTSHQSGNGANGLLLTDGILSSSVVLKKEKKKKENNRVLPVILIIKIYNATKLYGSSLCGTAGQSLMNFQHVMGKFLNGLHFGACLMF